MGNYLKNISILQQESEALLGRLAGYALTSRDCTLHMLASIQLLVQPDQNGPQGKSHDNRHDSRSTVHTHGHHISGSRRTRIHVRSINTAGVGDSVDASKSSSTLGGRTRDGVADPGQSDDIAGVDAGYHEHHGYIAGCGGGCAGGEDEGGNGEAKRDGDMEEAFAGAVCVDGIAEGGDDGQTVGWCGQTQTDNLAVAQCLYDYSVLAIYSDLKKGNI